MKVKKMTPAVLEQQSSASPQGQSESADNGNSNQRTRSRRATILSGGSERSKSEFQQLTENVEQQ